MPKAIRGLEAADNGNEFLCLNCRHGAQRSGSSKEQEVTCSSGQFKGHSWGAPANLVTFKVTQCSGYLSKDMAQSFSDIGADVRRIAYYFDRRQYRDGEPNLNYGKFIDATEAAKTDLIDDYDLH